MFLEIHQDFVSHIKKQGIERVNAITNEFLENSVDFPNGFSLAFSVEPKVVHAISMANKKKKGVSFTSHPFC